MKQHIVFIGDNNPKNSDIYLKMQALNHWNLFVAKTPKDINRMQMQGSLCLIHAEYFLKTEVATWRTLKTRHNLCYIVYDFTQEHEFISLKNGADDYIALHDPFDYLINRVSSRLEYVSLKPVTQLGHKTSNIVRFNQWHFDLTTLSLYFEGNEIHLTQKEKLLMNIFIQHDFEILSREKLHAILYGETDNPEFLRRIDLLVSRLKRRLESYADEHQYFQAIRHKGYIFCIPTRW
ncbi:winged helix-turn-helix domain-containing protein [Cysteiniphilum sp. JM-1]|uniref:winged helix-turn-helix domain-containing protein n=1 Tax=Cysteiniphilum sp. JM-1 TaxID=2610891 RepID=UPI001248E4A0|nr:winged helix-turn-helix domain-containing protein [Cysteiniphilum sp. JM-1]